MNMMNPLEESVNSAKPTEIDVDQKERHFNGFFQFDTIPAETVQLEEQEEGTENEEGAELSWMDWWEHKHLANSRFIQAIAANDIAGVKALLDEKKQPNGIIADVNNRNEQDGTTPLHIAVLNRNQPIIEILLKVFAELNALDFKGRTSLMLAVLENFLEEMQILAEHPHANIDLPDLDGNAALHHACITLNEPAIAYLLDTAQADPNLKNKKGLLPLDCIKDNAG